jgi:hypothetical protein
VGAKLTEIDAGHRHMVLKCHGLDTAGRALCTLGSARIVYTHRTLYDAIASWMQMFNTSFEDACGAMHKSLHLYRFLRECGNCLFVPYDSVTADNAIAIRRIAEYLGLDVPETRILAIADLTSLDRMKSVANAIRDDSPDVVHDGTLVYDGQTLLHRNHVRNGSTGYGRAMLSQGQCEAIGRLLEELGVPELGS